MRVERLAACRTLLPIPGPVVMMVEYMARAVASPQSSRSLTSTRPRPEGHLGQLDSRMTVPAADFQHRPARDLADAREGGLRWFTSIHCTHPMFA